MAKLNFDQSLEKAKQYASGAIPLNSHPQVSQKIGKSTKGFCDYCNQERTVIFPVLGGLFFMCWRDICRCKETHGVFWESKIETTLKHNRTVRLAKLDQKKRF